jgi:hypothetical protein
MKTTNFTKIKFLCINFINAPPPERTFGNPYLTPVILPIHA